MNTAVALVAVTADKQPLAGVIAYLQSPTGFLFAITNTDGYAEWPSVPVPFTGVLQLAGAAQYYQQPVSMPDVVNVTIRVGDSPSNPQDVHLPPCSPFFRRPAAVKQPPLPAFDPDDPGGNVATTLPPEQVIPPSPNIDWWRGDMFGVTLPPPDIMTVAEAEAIGANTTPVNMLMSWFLPKYSRAIQDRYLTAVCQRGYTHLVLSRPDDMSPTGIAAFVQLAKYVQSWGLYVCYWGCFEGDPHDQDWDGLKYLLEPVYAQMITAKAMDINILGKELNSWNQPGPNGLDSIIAGASLICAPAGVPIYLHFTQNVPAWQPPSMTPVAWWASLVGQVRGLCWQANPYDPAGTMAAHMWDSRKILGAASDTFRLVSFETRATAQLYGQCDEAHGALTDWENICAPNAPGYAVPAVAGFGNGGWYPDGTPI